MSTNPGSESEPVQAPAPAPAPTAAKKDRPNSNPVALIGLVLAVPLWPIGAILSLVGLVRSGKLGGTGRAFGIVGLALSLLVGTGSIAYVALHRPKYVDRGCPTAESAVKAFRNTVLTDQAQIEKDRADYNTTLTNIDINGLVNDMITNEQQLSKAEPAAASADLQNAVDTMDTDLLTVITGYQALQQGDVSQTDQTQTASGAVLTDADKIDGLCK